MRFFDLVKQHDRVGATAHGFGQLSALVVADISRRRADQAADGVLFHVFAHVDANHGMFVVK